ncbi:pantoate--beta-alanine ligase [Aquidulcibacter paucihalophilus]|uniref:pantoate--beta-alanine ligase n=1 Tax=Aquidulcibacter paucihalophilus TaxID=1978549 RepID=UPI000A194612|nr:pantoate--beta-alanine ligase [Aquidulcibacter paucihalophilus]
MASLSIVRTRADLRALVSTLRQDGKKIALVPTMGALHAGHLALIEQAKAAADGVIASIFVNPTQFAPHEDLARYPRQEAADIAQLQAIGCDGLYAPPVQELYPEGFQTRVVPGAVAARLEGAFRPHFFGGVATVVAKLFLQVDPDVAVFGEKDWQQLQVISTMVRDLDLGVEILPAPTHREADGLALSSRNAYLSEAERAIAPTLKQALDQVAGALKRAPETLATVIDQAKAELIASGFHSIDYLEACHSQTLEPWQPGDPARILAAAWLGKTRLIDNRGLD